MKTIGCALAALLISLQLGHAQDRWEVVPSLLNGTILSLAQSDDGVVYAGSDVGGVYRSTNDGELWQWGGMDKSDVRALLWNNGRLYAGMGLGVEYSDDGGTTWTNAGLINKGYVSDVAVNSKGDIFVCTHYGFYRTTNDGTDWEDLSERLQDGSQQVISIAVSSTDKLFITAGPQGIQSSSDNGNSWIWVDTTFQQVAGQEIIADGIRIVAAVPSLGVVESTDNGSTWEVRAQGLTETSICAVTHVGGDELYAGSRLGNVYYSTDFGKQWTEIGQLADDVRQILRTPTGVLAACGYAGVFRRTSDREWTRTIAGLTNRRVYDIDIGLSDEIYLSSRYDPLICSTDYGVSWIELGGEAAYTHQLAVSKSGRLYAATLEHIITSTDRGNTWEFDTVGISQKNIRGLALRDDGVMIAAAHPSGVFRSEGPGQTWTDVGAGLNGLFISELAFAGSYIYAGTMGAGMYRSSDEGATWEKLYVYWKDGIYSIAFSETTGELFAGVGGGVCRSTDMGDSWEFLKYNYPRSAQVVDIDFSPAGDVILTDDYSGIHILNRQLKEWVPMNDGLHGTRMQACALTSEGILFAGAKRNGLFRRTLPVLNAENPVTPFSTSLEQNYPNPFNPTTTINFTLTVAQHVSLIVTDLLGREARRVLDGEFREAGSHQVQFDAAELASGVYCCNLIVGEHRETRKMLLLR